MLDSATVTPTSPPLDRAALSALAHTDHPVGAPVHDDAVAALLAALPLPPQGTVSDLGCGSGQWLVRLLAASPSARGTGVDLSRPALDVARRTATAASVDDRVVWVEADASAPPAAAMDAALCLGSTHVFGGLLGTLSALRAQVRPGGALLIGDGFWEAPPSARALESIGELPDLAALVGTCRDVDWEVVAAHVSTADEWDAYEWSWTGSLIRWGLARAGTPQGEQALAVAREHRDEWLHGYRGQLGFVCLVLQDARR